MVSILAGVVVLALAVRAAVGREGFLPAAVNGFLGLAALLAVNVSSQYSGVHLGFNVFNGLVAGILQLVRQSGEPGGISGARGGAR